jgi:ATP-dependent protease Clp ATPase subunit
MHINADILYNQALNYLESILNKHGKSLKEFPNMPIPTALPNYEQDNHLIQEEQSYNTEELIQVYENGFYRLNVDQKAIFEKVVLAVKSQTPTMIFVDGPGGTGKTFLYK